MVSSSAPASLRSGFSRSTAACNTPSVWHLATRKSAMPLGWRFRSTPTHCARPVGFRDVRGAGVRPVRMSYCLATTPSCGHGATRNTIALFAGSRRPWTAAWRSSSSEPAWMFPPFAVVARYWHVERTSASCESTCTTLRGPRASSHSPAELSISRESSTAFLGPLRQRVPVLGRPNPRLDDPGSRIVQGWAKSRAGIDDRGARRP